MSRNIECKCTSLPDVEADVVLGFCRCSVYTWRFFDTLEIDKSPTTPRFLLFQVPTPRQPDNPGSGLSLVSLPGLLHEINNGRFTSNAPGLLRHMRSATA
jgi:hypothetical protein